MMFKNILKGSTATQSDTPPNTPPVRVDENDGRYFEVIKNLCDSCKHRSLIGHFTCKAFPGGIPGDFIFGVLDHTQSTVPWGLDDKGIVYEPKDGAESKQSIKDFDF